MKRHTSDNQKENAETVPNRVEVWRRTQGMWKNRKPDPITELNKMREEWEERLQGQEKIWRTSRHKEKKHD